MKPNNLTEFLNEIVEHKQHEWDNPQMIERWKRLAYLFYCNGGSFRVTGWGTTGYSGGIFKQGLTQDEGFELIEMSAIITGANWYDISFDTVFMPKIKEWLESLMKEYEEKMLNKENENG